MRLIPRERIAGRHGSRCAPASAWLCLLVVIGCASPAARHAVQSPSDAPLHAPAAPVAVPTAAAASQASMTTQRLPPVDQPAHDQASAASGIHLASHEVESASSSESEPAGSRLIPPPHAEPLPAPSTEDAASGLPPSAPGDFPIDLPTALQLADAQNLQVAFAREQIRQAYARVDRATALWLPNLRGGANYNRHEGAIQDVAGFQFNTSRGAFYTGSGAGVFGAGAPMVPGLLMNFHLADALFQPLAARQAAGARQRAAAAATNDTLWQVSLAYLELVRSTAETAIAADIHGKAAELAELTAQYARTGQGLQADADRAAVELSLRANELSRAEESVRVNSARLAQLLRLDPAVTLYPIDPVVAPIELACDQLPLSELVAQGLSNRPELAEHRFLVSEAVARLRREKYACLVPSVMLGASYGGMSAGRNDRFARMEDRLDLDAVAWWEVRNLGFGDRAARNEARSVVRQSEVRRMQALDVVAREVVEAHAQVTARQEQIDTARRAVESATLSYERNLTRIEGAEGLPIEVLQAIQALAQARREYLRTVVDYNAAQFTLHRAVGWPGR